MACIIQIIDIWNLMMSECCIAWHLTLDQSAESIMLVILILRASAIDRAIALRSPGSFAAVHEETRIGQKVVGVLLQVSIIGSTIIQNVIRI